jgi:hypothetical protein
MPGEPQVSRLDIHVDVAGVNFDAFEMLAGLVGRWRRIAPIVEDGALCGVAVGVRGGPIYARLYDKLRHIEQTGESTYLLDMYGAAGLRSGETVWRLEFELRRELFVAVKEPIRAATDAVERQGSLWWYCAKEWLRLAVPSKATRRERWALDARWRIFQDAPVPSGPPLEREDRQRHTLSRAIEFCPTLSALTDSARVRSQGWCTAWRR